MKTLIKQNRRLSADFRLLELEWPADFDVPLPGQFVMVKARPGTDPLWRRPFAVHDFRRGRGGATLSILFQVVGPSTKVLAEEKKDEAVDILGPFGRGFHLAGTEHWLVAGGRGVAPLFFLARSLKGEGKTVRIIVGGASKGHVLRVKELEAMGHRTEVVTEDGSLGKKGLVTGILEKALKRLSLPRRKRIVISACGPEGMLEAVGAIARRGKAEARLSLDTLMACGQGLCQGCTVKTKSGYSLCCRQGPVYHSGDIVW